MAATYGRLTGKPGRLPDDIGPRRVEILDRGGLCAARRNAHDHDYRPKREILSSRQARFQVVDVVASMKPLTELSRQIVSPRIDSNHCARGFQDCAGGAAGASASGTAGRCFRGGGVSSRFRWVPPRAVELPTASDLSLERAASIIMAAKRPLLMFGAAASRPPVHVRYCAIRASYPNSVFHNAGMRTGHGSRRH